VNNMKIMKSGFPKDVDMELREIYVAFCSFGKGDEYKLMDGRTFAKILKDSKIIAKKSKISTIDADIVFAKIVTKGKRKITYLTFVKGVKELAKKSKQEAEPLFEKILDAGGPTCRATKADSNVRWANKENFTGVATRGGPTTTDHNPNATGLGGLLDRSEYDIRGRKVASGPQKHKSNRQFSEKVVDSPLGEAGVGICPSAPTHSQKRFARAASLDGSALAAEDTAIFVTGNLKKNLKQLKRAMERLFEMDEEDFSKQIKEFAAEL